MSRNAYISVLLLALTAAVPAAAQQRYFEYQIEKPVAKPVRDLTASLTFNVDGAAADAVTGMAITLSARFSASTEGYTRPDSIEIRVESYSPPATRGGWPHALDHAFALVVDDSALWNDVPASYDTLPNWNKRTEVIRVTVPSADVAPLLKSRRISVCIGAAKFALTPSELIAARAFLQRALSGSFPP